MWDPGHRHGAAHHQHKRHAMHTYDIGNLNKGEPRELQKAQIPGEDAWKQVIERHIGARWQYQPHPPGIRRALCPAQPPRKQPQPHAIAQADDGKEEYAQGHRNEAKAHHGANEPIKPYPIHQRFRPPPEQQGPSWAETLMYWVGFYW